MAPVDGRRRALIDQFSYELGESFAWVWTDARGRVPHGQRPGPRDRLRAEWLRVSVSPAGACTGVTRWTPSRAHPGCPSQNARRCKACDHTYLPAAQARRGHSDPDAVRPASRGSPGAVFLSARVCCRAAARAGAVQLGRGMAPVRARGQGRLRRDRVAGEAAVVHRQDWHGRGVDTPDGCSGGPPPSGHHTW